MESVIKNIHLIAPFINENQLVRLNHAALQYRKFARITFKIVSLGHSDVVTQLTVEVRQDKSPAENYLDEKGLYEKARELFRSFVVEWGEFYVNTIPYIESAAEVVTPEYIRHQMTFYKIKVKDLVNGTGVERSNISAWMNGNREMSQPVRAMFYYFFLSERYRTMTPQELSLQRLADELNRRLNPDDYVNNEDDHFVRR